jgi:hypothetical protein
MRVLSLAYLNLQVLLLRPFDSCWLLGCEAFIHSSRRVIVSSPPPPRSRAIYSIQQQHLTIAAEDLEALNSCSTGTQARRIIRQQQQQQDQANSKSRLLFESIQIPSGVSKKGLSDGELALQTRCRNKYKITELIDVIGDRDADRASVAILTVVVSSVTSALISNQVLVFLPEVLRFIIVWLLTFAPLFLIGYGIRDAEQFQRFIMKIQNDFFPSQKQRIIQHEAGHFVMGYLLGLPIQAYQSESGIQNAVMFYDLADPDYGQEYARKLGFDRIRREEIQPEIPRQDSNIPFFGSLGRGADLLETQSVFRKGIKQNYTAAFGSLDVNNDPTYSWPYRGFDDRTLDKLTMVSLAGVCAEILAFGNAEGGAADYDLLRKLLGASQSPISDREVENRIRFGLGFTMSILRSHLGLLDVVAAVMERKGSVADCVTAIENCKNVKGGDDEFTVSDNKDYDYELRRRKSFSNESWMTRLWGVTKSIDTVEDRLVIGKGGGSRKESIRLAGDDPLYAALAVALVFLLWASTGGLSLH